MAAGHPNQGLNRYFAYFLQENGIMFEERDDFLNEKDYEYYEIIKKMKVIRMTMIAIMMMMMMKSMKVISAD